MLHDYDILCISSIDWDEHWQIHHEIMTTLASQGNRVLFVENTGVRTFRSVADLSRARQRIRNWWRGTKGFRKERENLFVYSPLFLPFPYSRIARWVNRVFLIRALRRWMVATGFSRPIVWTFLPTPLARDLMHEFNPRLRIYYCADDFSSSSVSARRISRSEQQILREADLVFVTSERLRERASRVAKRVHPFPAGVKYEEFERVRESGDEVPADLRALARPIIGYVGGLHQWVDQPLLIKLAHRMPEASLALVGPSYGDTSELAACPTVHLLGERPHGEIPRYIKGFDVGLVPYRVSEYTASVYPVKLNEYLAMGIPVVATDLPEIRRFNAQHGDIVSVAPDAEDFANAIRAATSRRSDAEVARRIEVARQNSWIGRIAQMSSLIETALRQHEGDGLRWEETLSRLYRTARRRTAPGVVAVLGLYVLLFHTPFLWLAAAPLQVSATPRPADAIVVFAGGVGESGKAGGGYQERVKQAVDLYRQGLARHVIFSTGYVFAFQEAEVMKALAVDNGVPAAAIVLETRAANTYQNVRYSREILRENGWRGILLVSSPYHMRRALLTWHKVAPDVSVVPTPVLRSQFYEHGRGASLDQIRGIVQEYVAIVVYWWRDWI